MKKIMNFSVLCITGLVLFSCFKSPDLDSLSNDLVVYTNRDLEADYTTYTTYYVSDTIKNIDAEDSDNEYLINDKTRDFVAKIRANMNAYGYTEVTDPTASVDLILKTTVVQATNRGALCYGWWWGWPYYPPYCSLYQYNTGSINVDMFDSKNFETNGGYENLWNSAMFGYIGTNKVVNYDKAMEAIDQAFEQSPYLKK